MIIKTEEIREGGLTVDKQIPAAFVRSALDDARGDGFRADDGFRFVAHLRKVGSGVLLDGKFDVDVIAQCGRCLGDLKLKLPAAFVLNLVPTTLAADAGLEGDDDGKAERGGSFRLEDAEQESFDGKVIDLDPILREQILLALPMNAVCRDDCKGLCGVCGQNLNEQACGCDPKPPDPRFAALKHIKLN